MANVSGRDVSGRDGGGRLRRSTAIFSLWTGVSRILGLVREIVAAALFGTQGAINAFVIAFQVPNLLRSLVADSALSAAFVPVYTELQEKGRHRDAQRLVGAMVGLIGMGLGAITLVAIIAAPWFMPFFAPGLPDDLVDEAVRLSRLMFPIVVLLGLTGLAMAVLQAHGTFGPTAFVPVLWNGIIIASLAVVAPFLPDDQQITVYAVGILLGTVAQLLFLVPYVREIGRFRPALRLGPHVKRVVILMLPVTVGLGLINVNLSVDAIFATLVDDQAPRAIDAAFRLYLLPQGVFSVAVATVLFPTISRLAARDDVDGVRDTVAKGLRHIFFVLLPASALLMVLAEPIVRLVFQWGAFDAESTELTSEALLAFSLGLVFNGASLLIIRAFFSLQQPWRPTAVAALGVVLNVVLDALLYQPLGIAGIPLATSIVSLVTFLVLLWMLARELGGIEGEWVLDGFLRSFMASAAFALLAWSTWTVLDDALGRGLLGQVVAVGGGAAAGALAYIAAAQAFEMPELRSVARLRRPLR